MFKKLSSLDVQLCLAACVVIAAIVVNSASVASEDKASGDDTIRDLLKERAETLKDVRKLVIEGHENGVYDFKMVHEARVAYLYARVDLCESKAERLDVLKELVSESEESQKIVEQAFKDALIGDAADVLRAKAHVLESRIALERALREK